MPRSETVLGVISDTHGLVRPEALAALAGAAQIVHAGDIGGRAVFDHQPRQRPPASRRAAPSDRWRSRAATSTNPSVAGAAAV